MSVKLINTGLYEDGVLFVDALSKYCECSCLQVCQCASSFDRSPLPKNGHNLSIKPTDFSIIVPDDQILGITHGGMESLVNMKLSLGKKLLIGVQILDYPEHILLNPDVCFDNTRTRWKYIEQALEHIDYFIISKKNVIKFLNKFDCSSKPILEVPIPVQFCKPFSSLKSNYIVYAGRINPDRRVDKIIEAISLSNNKPKLIVITAINAATQDFSELASRLHVDYEVFDSISQIEKYKIYSESSGVVNAGYGYCPAGCIIEGMMVNKPAAVYDNSLDNFLHYQNYVQYGNNNVEEFAQAIDKIVELNSNEDGMKYAFEKYSYDAWAKKVFEFIDDLHKKYINNLGTDVKRMKWGNLAQYQREEYKDTDQLYK